MKKMIIVFSCFIAATAAVALSTGCGLLNPAQPTATAVVTPTVTATADITKDAIVGVFTCVNAVGYAISYQVYVYDAAGVTVTTATVSVSGPNGVKNLAYNGTNYDYEFQSTTAADFQNNVKYTVSVTHGADTFAQDFITSTDITLGSGGSPMSWTAGTPGNTTAFAVATDPSMNPYTYLAIASPFDVAGTGLYTHGSGIYSVTGSLVQTINPAFGGSSPASSLVVSYSKTSIVLK